MNSGHSREEESGEPEPRAAAGRGQRGGVRPDLRPRAGEAQASGEQQEEASTAQAQPRARVDLGERYTHPVHCHCPACGGRRGPSGSAWGDGASQPSLQPSFCFSSYVTLGKPLDLSALSSHFLEPSRMAIPHQERRPQLPGTDASRERPAEPRASATQAELGGHHPSASRSPLSMCTTVLCSHMVSTLVQVRPLAPQGRFWADTVNCPPASRISRYSQAPGKVRASPSNVT